MFLSYLGKYNINKFSEELRPYFEILYKVNNSEKITPKELDEVLKTVNDKLKLNLMLAVIDHSSQISSEGVLYFRDVLKKYTDILMKIKELNNEGGGEFRGIMEKINFIMSGNNLMRFNQFI